VRYLLECLTVGLGKTSVILVSPGRVLLIPPGKQLCERWPLPLGLRSRFHEAEHGQSTETRRVVALYEYLALGITVVLLYRFDRDPRRDSHIDSRPTTKVNFHSERTGFWNATGKKVPNHIFFRPLVRYWQAGCESDTPLAQFI
jgi:hypothetical protein